MTTLPGEPVSGPGLASLELLVNAETICDLPVCGEFVAFEKVNGRSRHGDLFPCRRKAGDVAPVGGGPQPGHHNRVVIGKEALNEEALVGKCGTQGSGAFLVGCQIEFEALPWIARIVKNPVFRRDIFVGGFDVPLTPDFAGEFRENFFGMADGWHGGDFVVERCVQRMERGVLHRPAGNILPCGVLPGKPPQGRFSAVLPPGVEGVRVWGGGCSAEHGMIVAYALGVLALSYAVDLPTAGEVAQGFHEFQ